MENFSNMSSRLNAAESTLKDFLQEKVSGRQTIFRVFELLL